MASQRIVINSLHPMDVQAIPSPEILKLFLRQLDGVISGSIPSTSVQVGYSQSVGAGDARAVAGPAAALLTGSSLSGSVGAVLGRTTVTVTAAVSDAATMAAAVAAFNANATFANWGFAINELMQLTIATLVAGDTITINGVEFTAVAQGTSFTACKDGEFPVGASDTTSAQNLCIAIQRHPGTGPYLRAVRIAGVVYIGQSYVQAPAPSFIGITNPKGTTTITVQAAKPTAGAYAMVFCNTPGEIGNEVPLTASGTGMTATTMGTSGYLGHGAGGPSTALTYLVRP